VFKAGADWCWEVRGQRRDVVAHGTAKTSAKARAGAILVALTLLERQWESEHYSPAFFDYGAGTTMH